MAVKEPKARHNHATLKFPDGFLWGAATSGHQVEGNNVNNDWWAWEQKHRPPEERSGEADDQYNRFKEDFQLAKDLGHNAHRLSIEWSRIEPERGKFDPEAINHYKEVLKDLKSKGFTVMLTLNHFTIPEWMAEKGGYESFSFPKYFNRFVKKVVPELKENVDYWITINEPGVVVWMAYMFGIWPPQKKNNFTAVKAYLNMIRAHKKAYKSIHKLDSRAKVGVATNVNSFIPFHNHKLLELLTVWGSDIISNHLFVKFSGVKTHDFFGINYYFNSYISYNGEARFPKRVNVTLTRKDVSDMGWEIYPEGIFQAIMDFTDYHKPIIITENGLASTNDDRRCRFLVSYLKEVYHAIESGAHIIGYFHWSLIDNFEWADGFEPRFGLVEVDYATQKRTPRPSAYVYKKIIEENGIPHYIMKFIGHTVEADDVLSTKDWG